MRMHFAVGMGRNEALHEIADLARAAEESGFSFVTFVDQPYMSRDVFASMTLAAISTHRIHIGQGVIDPLTHHPIVIAGGTASINELSGGRALVGIGAGGPYGKAMKAAPAQLLREAVAIIRRLASGEEVEIGGQKVQMEFGYKYPLPIYIGCSGPRLLRLAGEIADGVMLSSNFGAHPAMLKWKLEQIEKGAMRVGRDPSKIDVWVRAMIYVTESNSKKSKEKALREVAGYVMNSSRSTITSLQAKDPELTELIKRLDQETPGLLEECQRVHDAWNPRWHEHWEAPAARFVTMKSVNAFHMVGTPEEICEKIYKVQQLGVRTVATVTYSLTDKKGVLREIGDRIMPHFRN